MLQATHFAASNDLHEHPRGHSSWRESTRMKFMNVQMGYSKMRRVILLDSLWRTTLKNMHRKFGREIG